MKRILLSSAVLIVLAGFLTQAQAQISAATSKHNFSSSSARVDTNMTGYVKGTVTEVCVYCHTPHRTTSVALLWNRTNPTASNFSMYVPISGSSGTLGDASLRCLSCHDGTTGMDALVKTPSTGTLTQGKVDTSKIPAATNLTNDHPVGFTVPVTTGWKGSPGSGGFAKLYSGKVECASCHDPHNTANGKYLRASNASSQICTDCHDK